MKKMNTLIIMLLLSLFSSSLVYAHNRYAGGGFRGHHSHGGFYIGPSIGFYSGYGFPPPYYYAPYYNYPPVINVAPLPPPVYIQRDNPAPTTALPANYWYYCLSPEGYYPYIKECPNGWVQVAPSPPLR